jgi:hypothetical protein
MELDLISNLQNLSFEVLFNRLSDNYDNKGLRDILLNSLFERKIEEIVLHLPQLAIILVNAHNDHIQKLLDHFGKKNQCFLFLVFLTYFLFFSNLFLQFLILKLNLKSKWIIQAFQNKEKSEDQVILPALKTSLYVKKNSLKNFNKQLTDIDSFQMRTMTDLSDNTSFPKLPILETGTHNFKNKQRQLNCLKKKLNFQQRRGSIQPMKFPSNDLIKTFKKSQTNKYTTKQKSKIHLSLLNFSESFQEDYPDFLDIFVKVISNFSLFLKKKQKGERKELLTIFLRKINWLIYKRKSSLNTIK